MEPTFNFSFLWNSTPPRSLQFQHQTHRVSAVAQLPMLQDVDDTDTAAARGHPPDIQSRRVNVPQTSIRGFCPQSATPPRTASQRSILYSSRHAGLKKLQVLCGCPVTDLDSLSRPLALLVLCWSLPSVGFLRGRDATRFNVGVVDW